MSIKGDVVTHLLAHRGEVISLTALASSLDVPLKTIRDTISALRSSRSSGGGGMRDDITIVSKGYAVKYVGASVVESSEPKPDSEPKPAATPTPAPVLKPGPPPSASSTVDVLPTIPVGVDHPYTDNVETVLSQLGPVAYKVFAYVASQNGQNVTGDEVVEATGLNRSAVSGAFYNTLFNKKQLNRNASRLFVKVGKDVYRMSLPGDGVTIGTSVKHSKFPAELPIVPARPAGDPVVARIVEKLYGDKETKRLFEEIRALPDGSILIEDTDGRVYKATEV